MREKQPPMRCYKESNSYPCPRIRKELCATLETLGSRRARIPGFRRIALPLHNLLKKNAIWEWIPQHNKAPRAVKENHKCLSVTETHPPYVAPLTTHPGGREGILVWTRAIGAAWIHATSHNFGLQITAEFHVRMQSYITIRLLSDNYEKKT